MSYKHDYSHIMDRQGKKLLITTHKHEVNGKHSSHKDIICCCFLCENMDFIYASSIAEL